MRWPLSAVLHRRAGPAGERRCHGRGLPPVSCAHRHWRTARDTLRVPSTVRKERMPHHPAGLCHCGGLWEAKKIAAMAETYYLGVAPHIRWTRCQRRRSPFCSQHAELPHSGRHAHRCALAMGCDRHDLQDGSRLLSLRLGPVFWGSRLTKTPPGKTEPCAEVQWRATTVRAHDNAILDW